MVLKGRGGPDAEPKRENGYAREGYSACIRQARRIFSRFSTAFVPADAYDNAQISGPRIIAGPAHATGPAKSLPC